MATKKTTKKTAKKSLQKKSPAKKPSAARRAVARRPAAKAGAAARKKAPARAPAPKRPARPKKPARAAAPERAAPAAPAPVPTAELPDQARPTALAIAQAGLDKKAEDVTVLDVRGLTSYADYFVVMTADSDRQAGAIADHVEQTMKAQGVTKVGVEGYEGGRWILVDYGDVIAHVMNRESRGFYDIEGLWADAPRFRVEA